MAENNQNVKVVKVKPYPINAQIKKGDAAAPIKIEILRLELFGFIFKANNQYFKTGDEYQCEFEIPVLQKQVNEVVKVIKTYEAVTGKAERPLMVEVHFKDKLNKAEDVIRKFILQIGQKSA